MGSEDGGDAPAAPPPVRHVRVTGGAVAVVELGAPVGPPAVLLSGLSDGLTPLTQPRTRALLADLPLPMERFRCLALSHPEPLTSAPTSRDLAVAAAEALRQLIDEPAVVVSHSLGAMVAQHLAVDAPELVRALVLSAGVARADAALRALLSRWERWLRDGEVEAFLRDALERSYTGRERERRRAEDEPTAGPVPSADLIVRHLALSHACATHDALDRLVHIDCPTLVLAGTDDEVAPPRHARQLASRVPGARLELLDGLGHAFPEQAPERFQALVVRFLDALSTPAPAAGRRCDS